MACIDQDANLSPNGLVVVTCRSPNGPSNFPLPMTHFIVPFRVFLDIVGPNSQAPKRRVTSIGGQLKKTFGHLVHSDLVYGNDDDKGLEEK